LLVLILYIIIVARTMSKVKLAFKVLDLTSDFIRRAKNLIWVPFKFYVVSLVIQCYAAYALAQILSVGV